MTWRTEIAARLGRLRDRAGYRQTTPALAASPTPYRWIGGRRIDASSSTQEFYEAYFGSSEEKCLIQVGANDGIMCDPLRRYLRPSRTTNTQALLIEPIPFYFEKLDALYADYPNISTLNAACGETTGRAPLYFIDPDMADQMNGNGPANNWAHGQGSFDRSVVEYWIARNRFRGEDYVRNIGDYYASIRSIEVDIIRLADVTFATSHNNLLIAVDVQGFELDVIRGIDWQHPPAYIVFEDDLHQSGPIDAFLCSRDCIHLCGINEKVYMSVMTSDA